MFFQTHETHFNQAYSLTSPLHSYHSVSGDAMKDCLHFLSLFNYKKILRAFINLLAVRELSLICLLSFLYLNTALSHHVLALIRFPNSSLSQYNLSL